MEERLGQQGPRGSTHIYIYIYTYIHTYTYIYIYICVCVYISLVWELGPQNTDGLLGPNSIIVVYMDPLGSFWCFVKALVFMPAQDWPESSGRVLGLWVLLSLAPNR